ncbi:MAG: DUF2959 family protein [Phycisphaerales bacterium]
MPIRNAAVLLVGLSILVSAGGGCASTRIALNERLGYTKREQLVDRVKDARDEQVGAKKQFSSALEEFKAITGVTTPADLEKQYSKIESAYERSTEKAGGVSERIASVERVANLLFAEWREEIKQISADDAKRASQDQLARTQSEYEQLLGAMKSAESKMQPVLTALNDRRLLLKHSLNAAAIASLQGNLAQLQTDIDSLIAEMEAAINEANAFIDRSSAK